MSSRSRRLRPRQCGWALQMLVLLSGSTAGPSDAASPTARARPDLAADAFTRMKMLVGTWQIGDRPTSGLRIRFYMTAGDTVLVEAWERAGVPYSMTVYHRDGATLIATHYCPQGNQPRLALLRDRRSGDVAFAFRDATDLDPAREAFLTRLSFDLSDPGHPIRRESYREKGKDAASELTLARATAE